MDDKDVVRQFVARAVFVVDGKVLLANKKGEHHLFIPGGRVEPGESVIDAVVREIKEELGLPCKIIKYLGNIEHSFNYGDNKKYYEVGHFFMVDIKGVDMNKPKSAEEEMQFSWVKIKELGGKDIRPKPVIKLLEDLNDGRKFDAFWGSTINS